MNHIIEALNKGWMVSEVVTVLARGQNEEGRGYLVTLLEPGNSMLHKLYLPYSAEIEVLLERASIPAAA
jgi:hypothetical protein